MGHNTETLAVLAVVTRGEVIEFARTLCSPCLDGANANRRGFNWSLNIIQFRYFSTRILLADTSLTYSGILQ
jgi:hypothetical protein